MEIDIARCYVVALCVNLFCALGLDFFYAGDFFNPAVVY
jgi:hypothetical protein